MVEREPSKGRITRWAPLAASGVLAGCSLFSSAPEQPKARLTPPTVQQAAPQPKNEAEELHLDFHITNTMPDHLVREPWAAVAALGSKSALLRGGAKNPAERRELANRFHLAFLSRAAVLGGKVAQPIESQEEQPDGEAVVRQYQDELEPTDIREAAKLWQAAWKEYERNDVFWDTLADVHGDPHVLHDVFIARRLFERKDPDFLEAYRNREATNRVTKFIREYGERARGKDLDRQLNDSARTERDARAQYHLSSRQAQPFINRRKVDGLYYAALFRDYCREDGTVNYDAVMRGSLAMMAQDKRRTLQTTVSQLRRQAIRLEGAGDAAGAKSLRDRMDLFERRSAELERAVKEKRFLRIHER